MIYLVKTKNAMTTWYYYKMITDSCNLSFNEDVIAVDGLKGLKRYKVNKRKDLIICGLSTDCFYLWIKGYKNIITWLQGVTPEERAMTGSSRIKIALHNIIEKKACLVSKMLILVSNAQMQHYMTKYRITLKNCCVVPCFNENALIKESFKKNDCLTFCYTGGLVEWQCVDNMLDIYSLIEKELEFKTKLLLLTKEEKKAKQMIEKHGVKNYVCKYVKQEELSDYLKEAKFGFVLRENSVVNNCSTPTKLSTYLANGIIPIYTAFITDFSKMMKSKKYKIELNGLDVCYCSASILDFIKANSNINWDSVYREYETIFSSYYNSSQHVQNLSFCLKKTFTNYGKNSRLDK